MGRILTLIVLLIVAFAGSALAVQDQVLVNIDFARQGDNILANVSCAIPDGYHAYAATPGQVGKPTRLDFVLEGQGKMPVFYPRGTVEKDIYEPDQTVEIYSGKVSFLAVLPDYTGARLYAATLDMLLCSNRRCLPYRESFTGSLPEKIPFLSDVAWEKSAKGLLEQESASSGSVSLEAGDMPPARTETGQGAPENLVPAPVQEKDETPANVQTGYNFGLSPRYVDPESEIFSLGGALLVGLLAGLMLNAMPCVLPVLTLKISGLLLANAGNEKRKLHNFRCHNIFFAAGIFTLFTVLALLLGLADLMWGQLYQNQYVLLAMLLIVFLMGLSMLGVFTLPAFDLRVGEDAKNPLLKAYLSGLVSTFLATPCSGPLLGGVLAWAFSQPLHVLTVVFWSVGAGMALPYIAFSIWPSLARILPRPGKWMNVFEHILGFLLLATAIYLLYILPEEKRGRILCVLLLAAFCAWAWGEFCGLAAPRLRRKLGGSIGILLLCAACIWALRPEPDAPRWQMFSPQAFERQLAHRDMLVEFTADWCPNCKFLEASVLTERNLRAWQNKYGLELVRADLTRSNPAAESLLGQLGSKSIPLTAIFPGGPNARKPLVLRDIYGEKTLEKALERAFQTEPDMP